MKKIKFISWQTLLILFVFYILIFVFIAPNMNYPKQIPDKLFLSSAEKIYSFLSSYSAIEKQNYINAALKFDIIFPITNSLFLFVFASLILNKITKSKLLSKLRYLPFVALIFDFTENSIFIFQINNSNNFFHSLDSIAALATNIKWISFILYTLLLLFTFLVFLFNSRKNLKN